MIAAEALGLIYPRIFDNDSPPKCQGSGTPVAASAANPAPRHTVAHVRRRRWHADAQPKMNESRAHVVLFRFRCFLKVP